MKKFRIFLSALLVAIILCSACALAATAAGSTITYTWQGRNAYDRGFAQGMITVSADSSSGGTYALYWADDNTALSGYYPICTLSVPNSGSKSFTMPENSAIPAKATQILGFRGTPSSLNASAAAVSYKLPIDKAPFTQDSDMLYSFASLSDIHISSNEEGSSTKYPYDEEHLTDAFKMAANRNVDFIVSTGDHVNNQRADSKGGANPFYPEEWNTYLRILAQSDYANPVYEAIGNHELWNYDTESNAQNKDWKTGSDYFSKITGLDSTADTINSGNAYFEITEPRTGDHFLFMALEGGFYTDRVDEFTDEQLDWLGQKLAAYENDGKNTFILEHANFELWGCGDRLDKTCYNLPLKETCGSTSKLKALLKRYKNAVFICGHTHFKYDLQLNYSTNDRTSATMIHNSSVGGVRNINSKIEREDDTSRELTEGYVVEVYRDATIFYGTNLYENKIIPAATYIVPQRTSLIEEPTQPPTQKPTEKPTEKPTQPPTEKPTEPPVTVLYGDADNDEDVNVMDVTFIQRYELGIPTPTPINTVNADVDGDEEVNIIDATLIQRYISGILHVFPIEEYAAAGEKGDLAPVGADLNTLRTQAKDALDKYISLASYDQYMALKKAYKTNADYATLNAAYNDFTAAVDQFYQGDSIDIYFSNNLGWSKVYAYCSEGHNKAKNGTWPGEAMKEFTTNKYGEKIYKLTVPAGKYNFVIFSNGSGKQTVDLPLGITRDQGYYYDSALGTDSRGYYRCSYYTYK